MKLEAAAAAVAPVGGVDAMNPTGFQPTTIIWIILVCLVIGTLLTYMVFAFQRASGAERHTSALREGHTPHCTCWLLESSRVR